MTRSFLDRVEVSHEGFDSGSGGLLAETFALGECVAPDGHLESAMRSHIAAVDDAARLLHRKPAPVLLRELRQVRRPDVQALGDWSVAVAAASVTACAVGDKERAPAFCVH